MRYLLDTQVWLWLQSRTARVPQEVRSRLAEPDVEVLLSAASAWEISIKYARGKLPLPEPPATYVPARMRRDSVSGLPITHAHTLHVATLPRHHGDPFDRLLVAQARMEHIPLVTADAVLHRYDVEIVSAR